MYLSSASFPLTTDTKWLVLTQWKGLHGGQPPVSINVRKNEYQLDGSRIIATTKGRRSLGTVSFNRWVRFVIGVRWISNENTGSVAVWRDGKLVASATSLRTMDRWNNAPDPIYLKQGVYRSSDWTQTHVAYFGPTLIGDTFEDVQYPRAGS